jgi:hypothetical protein
VESQLGGIWTTAELRSAGLSSRQIERLVGKGALYPLLTGVYASAAAAAATIGDARDDRARQTGEHLLRVAAALKVTGSRSAGSRYPVAGSHQSAARVHGLGVVGHQSAPMI